MKTIIAGILFIQLIFISGCVGQPTSAIKSSSTKSKMDSKPEMTFYVDDNQDNIFEEIIPEEKPIPFMGQNEFEAALARLVRYPVSARERGIAGYVVLEVLVNEFGYVEEVVVKRSLTKECDDVVKQAFLKVTENGYAQLKRNSQFVKYKVDYPFGFYLG